MQARATLESLLYYSKGQIKQEDITIILPCATDYEDIIQEFHFNWLFEEDEGGFLACLNKFFKHTEDNELILPAVDDLIYWGFPAELPKELSDHVIGLSLRLGSNIKEWDANWNISQDSKYLKWDWRSKPRHHGIAFELMGTIYRASTFKKTISYCEERGHNLSIPNILESDSWYYTNAYMSSDYPYLICYNQPSFCGSIELNRVQDKFPNRILGNENHTPQKLLELYKLGYRMDWIKLKDFISDDCFLELHNFVLTKN